MCSWHVTESSKKEILATEVTEKELEGRTENRLLFSKCWVQNTRYLLLGITWRCSKKFVFSIQAPKMLQEKKNSSSCSILPNVIALPNLRTCASFPVVSVPKAANTAVGTKSIVALRTYVTQERRSCAFINIGKHKTKSKENFEEVVATLFAKWQFCYN